MDAKIGLSLARCDWALKARLDPAQDSNDKRSPASVLSSIRLVCDVIREQTHLRTAQLGQPFTRPIRADENVADQDTRCSRAQGSRSGTADAK